MRHTTLEYPPVDNFPGHFPCRAIHPRTFPADTSPSCQLGVTAHGLLVLEY